jgi:hypothetical protein
MMSMSDPLRPNPAASDFDWVSARASCSALLMFQRLRMQVQADAVKRNEIRTANEKEKYLFRFVSEDGVFVVSVDGQCLETEIGVGFRRTPTGIEVFTPADNKPLFKADVTLSNDGECRMKIGEMEYNCWQFRKKALEDVFFAKVARWRP